MSITFTKWTVAVLTVLSVLSITTVQGSSGRFIDLFGLNNEAVQFFGMGFSYRLFTRGPFMSLLFDLVCINHWVLCVVGVALHIFQIL